MPKTKSTESYEHKGNFFEYRVEDEPVKTSTSKIPLRKRLEVGAIKMQKLPIALDIQMLDMLIAFLLKDSVLRTRKTINNIDKLMDAIDPIVYEGNVELESRVHVIQQIITCILEERFEDTSFIQVYCRDHAEDEYTRDLIDRMGTFTIKYAESKYLVKKIDNMLEYGYVMTCRELMMEIIESIDQSD